MVVLHTELIIISTIMIDNDKKDEISKDEIEERNAPEKENSEISEENKIKTDDEDASPGIREQKRRMRNYIITIIVIVCIIVMFIWGVKGCDASFNSFTP